MRSYIYKDVGRLVIHFDEVPDSSSGRERAAKIELDLLKIVGSIASPMPQKMADGTLSIILYHQPKDEDDMQSKLTKCNAVLAGYKL